MSKELNIIQAMEMPVGTKFNFDIEVDDAKFIEVLKVNDYYNILCWDGNRDAQVRVCTPTAKMKLTPIQKSVSFMKVVESGKKCRVEHELITEFLKSKKPNEYYFLQDNNFHNITEILHLVSYISYPSMFNRIIKEGKWYIKESEEN